MLNDEEVTQEDYGQRKVEAVHPDENVEVKHHEKAAGSSDDIGHRKDEEVRDGVNDRERVARQTDCDVRKKERLDGRSIRTLNQFCPDSALNDNSDSQNDETGNG